jgi:hypothetical protein
MFVTYPCADDKIMNVAVFHKTREHHRDADDWNSPAKVEDTLATLEEGFHPAWSAIAKNADDMRCFTVSKRGTLNRMHNGKAVLIGDSSDPQLPSHAHGRSKASRPAQHLNSCSATSTLLILWKRGWRCSTSFVCHVHTPLSCSQTPCSTSMRVPQIWSSAFASTTKDYCYRPRLSSSVKMSETFSSRMMPSRRRRRL